MLEKKAAAVKLLILDVDGVLTDGRLYINEKGGETKSFNVKDGYGLKQILKAGIAVAIISGRKSKAVEYRAKELGIHGVYQGVSNKAERIKKIMSEKGLAPGSVCAICDDLPDMPLFEVSGLAVAVADAVPEIREAADFVTRKKGGHGAVREVCDLILNTRKVNLQPPEKN